MKHTYQIAGMTCKNCVEKVRSELLKVEEISEADVQLENPQATITMRKHVPLSSLQTVLRKAGDYSIMEANDDTSQNSGELELKSWFETYKPILLIFLYVTLISIIAAASPDGFDLMKGMRVFMSGFFLSFSFFKLLDLKGFAANYFSYDIIAKKFFGWAYIYAFIELGLGVAYAVDFNPVLTNGVTFIVMSISLVGVLQSVLNKRKIRCACLGAVFNLPMSTVTIIEDALMIMMSGVMLIVHLWLT